MLHRYRHYPQALHQFEDRDSGKAAMIADGTNALEDILKELKEVLPVTEPAKKRRKK